MKRLLLVIAFCLLGSLAWGQSPAWTGILNSTRAIDWTTAGVGGIPLRPTACTVLSASSCPGGSSDCTPTIQAALNACTPGDNLSLQAGTYRVNTTISVPSNITLRCATPDLCILNSFVTSGPVVKAGTGWSAGTEVAATGATAGATVLTPTSTSGFTTGYALVSMTNDGSVATSYGGEGVCSFCDDYWSGARSTQVCARRWALARYYRKQIIK
jgi:hypothetical protein